MTGPITVTNVASFAQYIIEEIKKKWMSFSQISHVRLTQQVMFIESCLAVGILWGYHTTLGFDSAKQVLTGN